MIWQRKKRTTLNPIESCGKWLLLAVSAKSIEEFEAGMWKDIWMEIRESDDGKVVAKLTPDSAFASVNPIKNMFFW